MRLQDVRKYWKNRVRTSEKIASIDGATNISDRRKPFEGPAEGPLYGAILGAGKTLVEPFPRSCADNPGVSPFEDWPAICDFSTAHWRPATAAFRSAIRRLIASLAGLISNGPIRTPGCFDISAIAWFRSRASRSRIPPSVSLVST